MEVEEAVVGVSCSSMEEEERQAEVRVKRKTLMAVLEQCQRALELLSNDSDVIDDDDDESSADVALDGDNKSDRGDDQSSSAAQQADREADELCELIKSRFECPDFLEKLEHAQVSVPHALTALEEGNSWDMVNEKDLWEDESTDWEQDDDYVIVKQEDIVDGIACFMAAYLLSLKQTKDLTPNQLQEALSKTFGMKKKKGKLRKAWEGSQVIYNVASWGATAIGIYQNPIILRVATKAFWTSCQVISKLL